MEEPDYKTLVRSLPAHKQLLDQQSNVLVAQDSRHTVLKELEKAPTLFVIWREHFTLLMVETQCGKTALWLNRYGHTQECMMMSFFIVEGGPW